MRVRHSLVYATLRHLAPCYGVFRFVCPCYCFFLTGAAYAQWLGSGGSDATTPHWARSGIQQAVKHAEGLAFDLENLFRSVVTVAVAVSKQAATEGRETVNGSVKGFQRLFHMVSARRCTPCISTRHQSSWLRGTVPACFVPPLCLAVRHCRCFEPACGAFLARRNWMHWSHHGRKAAAAAAGKRCCAAMAQVGQFPATPRRPCMTLK